MNWRDFEFSDKPRWCFNVGIELFCALPIDKLDRLKLEQLTRDIGTQN
jgi:hypothetical protein